MEYNEIVKFCEELSCMDKVRLAQHLMQLARKEEMLQHQQSRACSGKICGHAAEIEGNPVEYVMKRIGKMRPNKKKSLLNSIQTMYQLQGGISEQDQELIIAELQKRKFLKIDEEGRVSYLH